MALSRGSSMLYSNLLRQCTRTLAVQEQLRRQYSDMAFTFASSAEVFYDKAPVRQIDVPSLAGSFGIIANHVPTLAVLKPGVVSILEDDGATKRFFVSSGSVTVNADSSVQILAEEAVPVEHLDAALVREGASKAAQELSAAATDVARAEAQIAVECYEALSKAVE